MAWGGRNCKEECIDSVADGVGGTRCSYVPVSSLETYWCAMLIGNMRVQWIKHSEVLDSYLNQSGVNS